MTAVKQDHVEKTCNPNEYKAILLSVSITPFSSIELMR